MQVIIYQELINIVEPKPHIFKCNYVSGDGHAYYCPLNTS